MPLVRLHKPGMIGEQARYDFWKGKPTEEIIESLKPDSRIPLRVNPDGTIVDGNTRIRVLEERGIDVNKLERIIEGIEKLPEP